MRKIKFIYFAGCPKVADQWRELLEATSNMGWQDLEIEKIDSEESDENKHYQKWGSPAILFGGVDITGYEPVSEKHCRYYECEDGGILPASTIEKLLLKKQ